MISKVIMPQGGQDVEVGKLVKWHKQEGDPVKRGEVVCEIETEKAVFEVQAQGAGVLRKIITPEGEDAKIYSTIAIIAESGEDISSLLPTAAVSHEPIKETPKEMPKPVESAPTVEADGSGEGRVKATPKARKMAADRGIALESIKGTGPGGRIQEKDVLDAEASLKAAPKAEPVAAEPASVVGGKIIPLTKIRKAIGRRLQQSKQQIPHFYITISVDMGKASKFRADFNKRLENVEADGLSMTDLIVKATALAMNAVPEMNRSLTGEDSLTQWEDINVGLAIGLDSGLVVQVIENTDKLTLQQVAKARKRLIADAQAGKMSSLAAGRITVSNLGMYDVEHFAAIVNPPEVGILAVASTKKTVVPTVDGGIGFKDLMAITLSCDHRVVDGVIGAKFLNKIKELLEKVDSL